VLTRHEASKDAELLVVRHENAVLRCQIGRVRYEPGDRPVQGELGKLGQWASARIRGGRTLEDASAG
jgi:hypothetical protein